MPAFFIDILQWMMYNINTMRYDFIYFEVLSGERVMAYFMIDLENTHNTGLKGAEYLCPDDQVVIFFSQNSETVAFGSLRKMFETGCNIELCKLIRQGKNALDFYIAGKIGELYGGGYHGDVVIVSKDKHFQAVSDYWGQCVKPSRSVLVRPDIERSIVSLNENSQRRLQIQEELRKVKLEEAYNSFLEKQHLYHALEQFFNDSEYADRLEFILEIILANGVIGRDTYLSVLKMFGRKSGLEVYQRLKVMNSQERI